MTEQLATYTKAAIARPNSRRLPPFPEGLEHVWAWFIDLCKTRPATEVTSPITWAEINEFEYGAGLTIRPWEKSLIRMVDDIARVVWAKKSTIRQVENEVDISDTQGIGNFLRSKAAKQREG